MVWIRRRVFPTPMNIPHYLGGPLCGLVAAFAPTTRVEAPWSDGTAVYEYGTDWRGRPAFIYQGTEHNTDG